MDFAEADRQYVELKQLCDAGTLSAEAFDQALKELMVQDAQGMWWAKSRNTGEWNYHDAATGAWIAGQPPVSQPPVAPPPVQPVLQPQPHVSQPQPVSFGLRVLVYIGSLLIPLLGIILYFTHKNKPFESDRKMANIALILGIASLALTCLFYAIGSMAQ